MWARADCVMVLSHEMRCASFKLLRHLHPPTILEDNNCPAAGGFTDTQGLGGVRYIVLSHRDDVADHAKWAEHFPEAARIIHKLEANSYQGTE